MATYTLDTDDSQEAAITAAREGFNAYGGDQYETNAEYMAFVMTGAIKSYAAQYGVALS